MAGGESKWSWLSPERVFRGGASGRKRSETGSMPALEEDNPWLTLQNGRQRARYTEPFGGADGDAHPGLSGPSAQWLGDESSPYGFSDEDGTLKQIESANWRRGVPGKRSRQFVPARTSTPTRWQPSSAAGKGVVNAPKRTGSTWMFQSVCAVALVAGALYAHQSHNPVAQKVQGVFEDMFQKDFAQDTLPTVENFFNAHHITVPAFGSIGAIHLRPPINGTIATDYSTTHPEMVLTGTANETVVAAGSGTVRKVVKLSSSTMVTIDHGSLGSSTYVGLAAASVHENEYVSAGQIIGKLPNTKTPLLHFTLEKNGHNIDPHDEIQFAGSGV